jgi:arginine/ornithine transport system permease protein
MMASLDLLRANLPLYGAGLLVTLELVAIALLVGGALAIPLALLRCARQRALSAPVALYTYLVRSTPMLVQLMAIYYGLGQLDWMQRQWANEQAFWLLWRDPFFCAALAFTVNTCAYTTEILAGAMRSTPHGEIEAARALGMSNALLLRRIVLPGALRRSLPAYGNEVILMLQGSSIAGAVTLIDLTGAARAVNARHFAPFEAFLFAGLCYFLLTLALSALLGQAERRWLAHLQPRRAAPVRPGP